MANSKAIDVMRIALRQYAYKESPAGSNRTKYGKAYGANGVPWCAENVWWDGEEAPGTNPIAKSYNAAYIQDLTVSNKGGKYILKQTANNDKKKAALPKYKFGDIISFNFNGGSSRAHTGLIVGRSGNTIYCIEGNTSFSDSGSQSNGGCVALRKRNYTTGVCVVRPKYSASEFHTPTAPYGGSVPKLPSRGYFKYGDKSDEVKKLQKALKWANGCSISVDGDFGSYTFAEVVIFQVANGLVPDGEFGKNSLDKLNEVIKKHKQDTVSEAPVASQKEEIAPVDKVVDEVKKVEKISAKVLDVSAWQGEISESAWKKVIGEGITAVILRSSYTNQASFTLNKDKVFDHNIKTAIKAGMHIGIYHYSQAITEAEAKKEAEYCLKIIEPYKKDIDLPVAFDWEFGGRLSASKAKSNGKTKNTAICSAFCNVIKAAGFDTMVYANLSTLNNYLSASLYKSWKIWVAQYNSTCDYKYPYYMWQYTSSGKSSGISGKLDVSKIFDTTKAEKIVARAKLDSWPYGTDKKQYAYPDGKPQDQYKKDLKTAYGDRAGWGTQPKKGASCDVFVGTVLRVTGIDKKFPRGLSEQVPYLKKSDNWASISTSAIMPGDVIYQKYNTGGEHICICTTPNRVANAHYKKKTYPIREKFSSIVKPASKCKVFKAYRAV